MELIRRHDSLKFHKRGHEALDSKCLSHAAAMSFSMVNGPSFSRTMICTLKLQQYFSTPSLPLSLCLSLHPANTQHSQNYIYLPIERGHRLCCPHRLGCVGWTTCCTQTCNTGRFETWQHLRKFCAAANRCNTGKTFIALMLRLLIKLCEQKHICDYLCIASRAFLLADLSEPPTHTWTPASRLGPTAAPSTEPQAHVACNL